MPLPFPVKDRTQLLDALWHYQHRQGYIDDAALTHLSQSLGISKVEIEGIISFYHFFKRQAAGKYTIYLNNSILSEFAGFAEVRSSFEEACSTKFGAVDPDGNFGLFETSCIGLSDQEPAALINFHPFIKLTPLKVNWIIRQLKNGAHPEEICDEIPPNIQYFPPHDRAVYFRPYTPGHIIRQALKLEPESILSQLESVRLNGMGGAFFPVYLKWAVCRKEKGKAKYIVCNADEGEPGTFKDRVLMQQLPGLMLEGMLLSAYVTGAREGIIYLRAEYHYLQHLLQQTIDEFETSGLLGRGIAGQKDLNFRVRIQLGAGAYVCGEETALLQSMEGYRGEPRPKLHYPTQRGFLQQPTVVNNVETFIAAARVIDLGVPKILENGLPESPGNKVLSVAGDCRRPGIYEIEWGTTLEELLYLSGAEAPVAVQLSGPSGELVPVAGNLDRRICRQDLPCGGSVMIFNQDRDLMQILQNYNRFFMQESCGICTPCRGGNFILSRQLERIEAGLADQTDLAQLREWAAMMRYASRCGLGKTAPNSIIQAIDRFPNYFQTVTHPDNPSLIRNFRLEEATATYDRITRKT